MIHAGIYYTPGSLKARMCVAGARAMYELCERRGIAYERCGKLIVARDESELAPLDELERRGRENAVPGLRRLGPEEIEEVEPHCVGASALHSPDTGIVDFARGGARRSPTTSASRACPVVTGCGGERRSPARRPARARPRRRARRARASPCSPRAHGPTGWRVLAGAPADPRIVPFRGSYLKLRPERRELVRGMIYPVPDPSLPFLGVHLTRHIDGEVSLGPTALLAPRGALARDRRLARHLADGAALVAHRPHRDAPRGEPALAGRGGRRLRARARGAATSSPTSPACAPRRSAATAASWTTSWSRRPSARSTCATRPRPPPPRRWRWPALIADRAEPGLS